MRISSNDRVQARCFLKRKRSYGIDSRFFFHCIFTGALEWDICFFNDLPRGRLLIAVFSPISWDSIASLTYAHHWDCSAGNGRRPLYFPVRTFVVSGKTIEKVLLSSIFAKKPLCDARACLVLTPRHFFDSESELVWGFTIVSSGNFLNTWELMWARKK